MLLVPGLAHATQAPTISGAVAVAAANPEPPSDLQTRRHAAASRFGVDRSPAEAAIEQAINPDDHECGPTDLDAYVGEVLAGMTASDIDFLLTSGVLEFPTFDALVFGSDTDPRYALAKDYAHLLGKSFRDAKRFWDIQSNDIQLHAMHGDMLLDTTRLSRLLVVVYGLSEADAAAYAAAVAARVASTPAFAGGNNPIFTLNAFAFTGEGDPDPFVASLPDKLIFGDGVLDALDWMGIGNVGSRAVLGHEFGHHIQFEQDLFDSPLNGPEATRRTELMAESFATYFATHARGLSLNTKRVLDAVRTFYVVGDCAFDDPGHHGTPNQRMRAAEWGADLAATARPQGKVLPSLAVADLFEAQLPAFVAPDAD